MDEGRARRVEDDAGALDFGRRPAPARRPARTGTAGGFSIGGSDDISEMAVDGQGREGQDSDVELL